jgi:hypothetical protein
VRTATALTRKVLAFLLALATLVFMLNTCTCITSVAPTTSVETQKFVHNFTSTSGNGTYLEKPVFPVKINNMTIPIGANYTIICPLVADFMYHVYCYGDWVHTGPEPKTDYDIYVYNPQGQLESTHTEAAGLPEHLGTTVDAPYFTPKETGNYTFVLINDARESAGAEPATFMIIQHLDTDVWYTHDIVGKNGSQPQLQTSWSYEFMTNTSHIEVYVKVPDALDMYEVRLYMMSDKASISINNISLPWEPGLYGNQTTGSNVGGYNLESEGYRGIAYASCEYMGKDMFLNYTVPATAQTEGNNTETVYHLVLMGEVGEGTVEFLIKTNFGGGLTSKTIPMKVTQNDDVPIAYASDTNPLQKATLQYTIDDWANSSKLDMAISNMTCNATIPKQPAGTAVKYRVTAFDSLENNLTAYGEYGVKQVVSFTGFKIDQENVLAGFNVSFTGQIDKAVAGEIIDLQFMSASETQTVKTIADEEGIFTAEFSPNSTGTWTAQATFAGNTKIYETASSVVQFKVGELNFVQKNSMYIGIGFAIVVGAFAGIVYIKNKRS